MNKEEEQNRNTQMLLTIINVCFPANGILFRDIKIQWFRRWCMRLLCGHHFHIFCLLLVSALEIHWMANWIKHSLIELSWPLKENIALMTTFALRKFETHGLPGFMAFATFVSQYNDTIYNDIGGHNITWKRIVAKHGTENL